MAKVLWKGGTLLGPLPAVMVTCGDMENSNIITVAWCGIINSDPPKTYISVRPERYSYGIIKERGEFAINLTGASIVKWADYLGVYTGRKIDKFKKSGLTKAAASEIACPLIEESPLSLECRVTDIVPLGSHDMFIADIVAVDVDESLLDKAGKLHIERAGLAAFAHGEYFALGRSLGQFGFSVAKKKKNHKKSSSSNKNNSNGKKDPRSKPATER
ncbi:MAG: flavin reductase family protein [Clostridia bacterium]|nr:flavin reductase family protein [Clostridia bacterium]